MAERRLGVDFCRSALDTDAKKADVRQSAEVSGARRIHFGKKHKNERVAGSRSSYRENRLRFPSRLASTAFVAT